MSTTNIPITNNQAANVSGTMQRPQWLDEQLYPFQSHFVEVDGIGTGGTRSSCHESVRRKHGGVL
jgi:hypothetical protein